MIEAQPSGARADARVERGRATRDRLVAAARQHFGQDGYERTSIAAVLDTAGVAKGALYHHFASKEGLFDAVLDGVVADIARSAAAAGRAEREPLGRLRAGCFAIPRCSASPCSTRRPSSGGRAGGRSTSSTRGAACGRASSG